MVNSAIQMTWAKRAADWYRGLGWNPLPSRSDRKAPALNSYAECHTELLNDRAYREWTAGNVQLVTGVKWNLAVIDCDGEEGCLHFMEMWKERQTRVLDERGDCVWPWIVKSGGGGLHFWYTLPEDVLWLPSKLLWGVWDYTGGPDWKGAWKKSSKIELIADGKLIVAPPSIHPDTGKRYEWFDDYNPRHHDRPGVMPDWILALPEFNRPEDSLPSAGGRGPPAARPAFVPEGPEYDREDVLAAIPNKLAVAVAFGLEVTGNPNADGWVQCRAVSRAKPGMRSEDFHPSASFQVERGIYMEMYDRQAVSLFDLGVMAGRYPSWRACLNDLGRKFGAVTFRESGRIKCT